MQGVVLGKQLLIGASGGRCYGYFHPRDVWEICPSEKRRKYVLLILGLFHPPEKKPLRSIPSASLAWFPLFRFLLPLSFLLRSHA